MGKQILNGVLYGTGEIIKFSPCIYSSEEREIGVWTDGKPLYEVTKVFTHDNAWEGKRVSLAHGIANIDVCVDVDGGFVNPTNNSFSKTVARTPSDVYTDGTNSNIVAGLMLGVYSFTKTDVVFILGGSYYVYGTTYNVRATFRYTKTTDSPGSGKYTTNGGEAVHYSQSEQIIGTWIDQKPLYEKTFELTSVPPARDSTILIDKSNIAGDATRIKFLAGKYGNIPINSVIDGTDGYNSVWGISDVYYKANWYNTNQDCFITIRYTKATD